MKSFLRQTAEAIVEKIAWRELSKTTLVLPSHRAGLVLKNELLQLQKERGEQAVWAPTVRTLQQLQNDLSPLYEEDELLTIVRLYKKYRTLNRPQTEEPMPLDMFYSFGRQMLADFTNVDASMPEEQVANFFDNTVAAHELSQLDLDEEVMMRLRALVSGDRTLLNENPETVREQYKTIWTNLYVLYTALRAEMTAERKGYSGLRQRAVIEHWQDESVQMQIRGRKFVFVGFNYLLPVERELMQLFKDAGQALFFWDYVPDFQTNEKAFEFAERNAGLLGNSYRLPVSVYGPKPVTVMACTSREAQAQYVHRWLTENYTEKGQKVGVVICDETMLESVIYTLPAITLPGEETPAPVNITKGFPLRNTHIYAQVTAWLYDKKRGDGEQVVTTALIDELERSLENQEPREESPKPREESTEAMSWQELLIMESEYQVRKIMNQMRKLIAEGLEDVPFTLKLLRLLMRRTMESVTMPFHGEPVTDIQVMGVLETRLLDFDKLLLLNVEEGILPQKQADSSFIPYYLRKAYSMQTSDERATVYAYNFFRLLSRAGHSMLLFTTVDGAENSKGMSRFIMQMLVNPDEFTVEKQRLDEPSVLEQVDDARLETDGVSLLSTLKQDKEGVLRREDGSRFTLSPSALNTYIACPRQFCLRYIKHWPEPEQPELQFDKATMGSFVHNAMLYLYRDYLQCEQGDGVLHPDQLQQMIADEELLQKALHAAYSMMNEEWQERHEGELTHYIEAQHVVENPVIIAYVRHILAHDLEDAKKGLQIYLLEQDRKCNITIEGVGVIRTGGRIDRMDKLGTGEAQVLRVVDYKSGSYNEDLLATTHEEWMNSEEARYIRQTLLYSHAASEYEKTKTAIEPNLFFCSQQMSGLKTHLTVDKQEVTDYRNIRNMFIEAYKEKVKEVLTTTVFPPCEPKNCASYCPFLGVCRRKVYTFE